MNIPTQEGGYVFGGLFAYDLVAGFEALPHLEAGNNCGLLLLLAETLMVKDHQKKSTRIQASLFTASDREKQRLNARLAYLSQQLTQPAPPLPVTPVPDTANAIRAMTRSARWYASCKKPSARGRYFRWYRRAAFHCPARRRWLPATC